MKYITLFETTAAYDAATLDLPNVSLIEETMSVGYKPYVPETKLICKYNVTDTSNSIHLRSENGDGVFKSMEIDGVMLNELVTDYTFDTVGVHTVKYELYDETKLGNNAPVFSSNNLIECIIPDNVKTICDYVFQNCNSLTSVIIGNGVTTITNNMFQSCTGLTSVTIGNSVTSIGNNAFQYCSSLTSIVIPDNVTSIGVHAFESCTNLTSVTIGSGVTSIGICAFFGCSGLTSVTIPDNVTSIGEATFNYCTGLTSIVIPDNVTSIGNSAFGSCSGLTSVTIGSGVTSIGNMTFNGCNSLTSIVSNAITAPTISNDTFYGIKTGGTLTVPNGSTGYDTWIRTDGNYLGKYNWTKVEQ